MDRCQKLLRRNVRFSIEFDDESTGCIESDAREMKAVCQVFDKGPKAHALNDAFEHDAMSRSKPLGYLPKKR